MQCGACGEQAFERIDGTGDILEQKCADSTDPSVPDGLVEGDREGGRVTGCRGLASALVRGAGDPKALAL